MFPYNEKLKKVRSLTKREMEVVFWQLRGTSDPEIAKVLDIAERTVGDRRTGFYKKLGLTDKNDNEKPKELIREYAQAISEVVPDEAALKNYEPDLADKGNTEPVKPVSRPIEQKIEAPRRRSFVPFVLAMLFMLCVGLVGGGFLVYRFLPLIPQAITEAQTIAATIPASTDTTPPSLTLEPTLPIVPTDTPRTLGLDTPTPTLSFINPPTFTASASPTEFVPPADGVLFEDTFDGSMSPEWVQMSGTWIVDNNRLTKLPYTGSGWTFETIFLNKPEWENFIVSLDIDRLNRNYPDEIVIVVGRNGTKLLGIQIEDYIFWGFIDLDSYQGVVPLTGDREYSASSSMNIEIRVENGVYSFASDGRILQTINLPGYPTEGIMIGVDCADTLHGCTKFDNVKVTYLP